MSMRFIINFKQRWKVKKKKLYPTNMNEVRVVHIVQVMKLEVKLILIFDIKEMQFLLEVRINQICQMTL